MIPTPLKLRRVTASACALSLTFTACAKDPVTWRDVKYSLAGSVGTGSTTGDSAGNGEMQMPFPDSVACRISIRAARAGKSFYTAWWHIRADSSSSLELSRSDDSGEWSKPVIADGSDSSSRGCSRPAPAISADIVSGYVHLAFYLEPAQGAGVFFVHSMDRGETFHSPVPIVFGNRPSATSVSGEGDRVAVAYEDPNSRRSQIFVALSMTAGHIFEIKLPVSEENADATDPVVKLHGTKLEVSWTERSPADPTHGRSASRTGSWK